MFKTGRNLLIVAGIALSLAGCITATPYQPLQNNGGYSEIQLNSDTYKINFSGNEYTSAETVASYALYRAAELTEQNGYNYFIVLGGNQNVQTSIEQMPTYITHQNTTNYSGYGNFSGNNYNWNGRANSYGNSMISGGGAYIRKAYSDYILIKTLKNNKRYQNALNAESILGSVQVIRPRQN